MQRARQKCATDGDPCTYLLGFALEYELVPAHHAALVAVRLHLRPLDGHCQPCSVPADGTAFDLDLLGAVGRCCVTWRPPIPPVLGLGGLVEGDELPAGAAIALGAEWFLFVPHLCGHGGRYGAFLDELTTTERL